MNDKYALGLLGQGYQNSGGWRFGGKTSGDFLQNAYTPEAYNQALLDLVGNKKGAVDQALSVKPVDNVVNTGLLQGNEGRGDLGNGGNAGGFGVDSNTDRSSLNSSNSVSSGNMAAQGKMAGAVIGSMLGLGPTLGGLLGGKIGSAINGEAGYNGYGQLGNGGLGVAGPATGPGTIGVRDSYGSNESGASSAGMGGASVGSAGSTAGSVGSPDGPDGNNSGYGGGYGGNDSGGSSDGLGGGTDGLGGADGQGNGSGLGGNDTGGGMGWAMGGMVKKGMLSGPNPAGPDDGYGALKNGEYVIKASAVKKYGKGLLGEINSGTFKR